MDHTQRLKYAKSPVNHENSESSSLTTGKTSIPTPLPHLSNAGQARFRFVCSGSIFLSLFL